MKFNSFELNQSRKVTIIGGRGRMGKFFTQQLLADGHQVSNLGNQDWENASQLLGEAELVIVSVPIEKTVAVIERAAKYLSPNTALADITSIKTQPVQAMLANHSGPVMGLHPMFGPSVKSFAGQKVVTCSGRDDDAFGWLLYFIADRGGELINCTPEEHDRIMVTIQATRHFARFCCGVFLSAENVDIDRSLLMSTPSYRQEIEIVNRLFAQNPTLAVDIMLATEERSEAIARLAQTYSRLAQLVVTKDRSALIREFENAASFLHQDNTVVTEQGAGGAEGAGGEKTLHPSPRTTHHCFTNYQLPIMLIDIFHDFACPWCWIGNKQLFDAIAQFPNLDIRINWHPFLLDSSIPPEGYEFRSFMQARKGVTASALEQIFAHTREAGEVAGVKLNFDRISLAVNTTLAHQLISLTPEKFKNTLVAAIYQAYFEADLNIGNFETLISISNAAGVNTTKLHSVLRSQAVQNAVVAQSTLARLNGVTSVPLFIFNNTVIVNGSQSVEALKQAISRTASSAPSAPSALFQPL